MSIRVVLQRCEDLFGIQVLTPLAQAAGAHVFLASRAGKEVVLKIGVNEREISREVRALMSFSSRAAILIINYDESLRAVLQERAVPGHPLSAILDDAYATEIFCSVFQRLQPAAITGTHELIQDHVSAIDRYHRASNGTGPLPKAWVDRSLDYLYGLIASTDRPVLLHGDLHHGNILYHRGDWVVIDPKGIIGDRHFEPIQYLLNYPRCGGDAGVVLARRMTMLTERLALDGQRIARWGVVKGLLDACWALEEGKDWQGGIENAERFERWLTDFGHS